MATPAWFEEDYYLNQKLAQLRATDPTNWKSKTVEDVKKAFDEAGFTPYDHWVAYGNSENVSPTSQFDINFYIAAKVNALNAVNYEGKTWTMESVLQAFEDAGMSAWDHYHQFGSAEDIAPNSAFDSGKYYQAKVAQLNDIAYEGRSDWTVDQVKAAFAEAGITALEHYADYGKSENIASFAKGAADFNVVDQKSNIETIQADEDFDANGPGVKSYTLESALVAKATDTLPEAYNMKSDLNAGDVTAAQYGQIKGILDGALNSADIDTTAYTYTLNDSYTNLVGASSDARANSNLANGTAGYVLTDSIDNTNVVKDGHLNTTDIAKALSGNIEYHLTGTSGSDYISEYRLGNTDTSNDSQKLTVDTHIPVLAGGNGADYIRGGAVTATPDNVLFGGSITEKDDNGVYAESQDVIASGAKQSEDFMGTFVKGWANNSDHSEGLGTGQWIEQSVVNKYFNGHNVLDGGSGKNDLVASNQADTFLIQLGGHTSGNPEIEKAGFNTIHNFKVGQDYIFVMDQSDRDGKSTLGAQDELTFSSGWTKDAFTGKDATTGKANFALANTGNNSYQLTISKEFLTSQELDATNSSSAWQHPDTDLIINLVGVQGEITSANLADLFGIA